MPSGHWNLVNSILNMILEEENQSNTDHILQIRVGFLNIIFVLRMNTNYDHKAVINSSFALKSS